MDDLMEQFKQAQIVREAQYSSDIQQLRAELTMIKALYEEEREKSRICQEELSNVRLQLTTALATQTIKVEHLSQQNTDNVLLIKELQQQNNLKQQQIDAIRQHFLDLQQQNQQLSLDKKALQTQLMKTKSDAEESIRDVKEAVAGLQLLAGKNMDLTPVTDVIFQAKSRNQSPLDLALAKLATETKKYKIAEQQVEQLQKQIDTMQKLLKKCTPDVGLATTAGNGVQLLYNQLNAYKETIEVQEQENLQLKEQLKKTSDIVRGQEQEITKLNAKLSLYRQNIREVASLRKAVRQMIKDEID